MVEIYTDGSCLRNPGGPSGSGVVMIYKQNVKVISYGLGESTNNRAELVAIQKALEAVKFNKRHYKITVFTDSKYAIGVLSGRMKAVKNTDLIHDIRQDLLEFTNIEFKWVKGHNGNKWNEVADRLALMASKGPKDSLFVKLFDSHDHPFFASL